MLAFMTKRGYNDSRLAESGLWLQADASRRQSGPRKPAKAPVSMVRSRSKPGRAKQRERMA